MSLTIKHKAGFFSCCSIKLDSIVNFVNANSKLPNNINGSKLFTWYKTNKTNKSDITYEYFEHYNNIKDIEIVYPIEYNCGYQFINYSNINYKNLLPLITKYFTPSKTINNIIKNMEEKYNLVYDNVCVLFYRGNDKIKETKICNYEEYLEYTKEILKKNPHILFLIQSDETEFIEFMTQQYPNNSFYFKDEIRHINKSIDTVDRKFCETNNEFSKKYLAITVIMSKCKYIICGSGNCSIWIMFYRGNNNNVMQNLNGCWYNNLL